MHDKHDTIIYVGKAKVLKNRVRQYFQSSKNHSAKVVQMVSHIAYFEYIVTQKDIKKFQDEVYWRIIYKNQKLSENFKEKFKYKLNGR